MSQTSPSRFDSGPRNMKPEQIKAYRKKAGLTQFELAKAVHVTTRAIQMYEAGHRTPEAKIAVDIMRALKFKAQCPACGKDV